MKLIVDKSSNGLTNPEFIKYLKTPVPKSELTQFEADILRDTLFAALKGLGGVGLSANQIGVNKRACVIKINDTELFLLNPIITERSKDGFLFYEGCLSIPSTMEKPVRTIRANYIVVQTDNLGEIRFEINPGFSASKIDKTLTSFINLFASSIFCCRFFIRSLYSVSLSGTRTC